jgi:TolB-like protein/Tfp pilus assembly protein PilF
VLPFTSEKRFGADDDYLADGLTESVIQSLSRLPQISVMSSSSVFRYKDKNVDARTAGHDLGVEAVLSGRIVRRGDNIYVSAELVDAGNGRVLWGQQYETAIADVMTLQNQIAAEISEGLRVQLSGDERRQLARRVTADPEAYQAYLKGRFYWNKRTPEGFEKAIEYFNQAIVHDPAYALAYAGLADTYILQALYGQQPPREAYAKARAAALQALQSDPDLPEARTSLAYVYRNSDGDLVRSSAEFRKALAVNPNYATAHHWYSLCLADMGQIAPAIAEIEHAAELDPLSPVIYADYAGILNDAGRTDEALVQIRKALEIDPELPFAHHIYAEIHLRRGDAAKAIDEASKAWSLGHDPRALLRLGQAYVLAGRKAEAAGLLVQLDALSRERFVSPYVAARLAAVVGEREKAIAYLQEAVRVLPSGALSRSLASDRLLDPLRSDPRFSALR